MGRQGWGFHPLCLTPARLANDTGRPKDPELLMTLAALRDELIDKIHKVEALFKTTRSQGEMQAVRGPIALHPW